MEYIDLPGGYKLRLWWPEAKPWDLWVTVEDPNGDDILQAKYEDEDGDRFRAFAAAMNSR